MAGLIRQCVSSSRTALATLRTPLSLLPSQKAGNTVSCSLLEIARPVASILPSRKFHLSHVDEKTFRIEPREPKNWPKYNDVIYPPTELGEPRRPAEICHLRSNVKYSTKKLWYLGSMIRGMSIEEALKQMSFHLRDGSKIVKEVLEEALEIAVRDYNVEYKSNLWVADSFATKAITVKGYRKHMGFRHGVIHYRYSHYFVRLREGPPPKHYYPPEQTGWEKMEEYLQLHRNKRIFGSL